MIGDWRLENCTLYVLGALSDVCGGDYSLPARAGVRVPGLGRRQVGGLTFWMPIRRSIIVVRRRVKCCRTSAWTFSELSREARAKKAARIADEASPEGPSLTPELPVRASSGEAKRPRPIAPSRAVLGSGI